MDGKAGMACLSLKDSFNPLDFMSFCEKIPPYQQPVFIRIVKEIPYTSTNKKLKTQFVKEGYNISNITDSIYVQYKKKYERLTEDLYNKIIDGTLF